MEIERIGYDVNAGEVAKLVGCSQRAAMAAVKRGELATVLIGARRIATRPQIDAWLTAATQRGIPKARQRAIERVRKGQVHAAASRRKAR